MRKIDYFETVEPMLFTSRYLKPKVTLKQMTPFLKIIGKQNKLKVKNARNIDTLLFLCQKSINYN